MDFYFTGGSFTKNKERIQKFKETRDSIYTYHNELDKVFNVAKNKKNMKFIAVDLVHWIIIFFAKKSLLVAATCADKSTI